MITKRSIGVAILLSIITCGIYSIYWFIVVTDDTNKAENDINGTSGGIAYLLTLVTCGIYGFYWAYKQGEKLDNAKRKRGIPSSNSEIIYLVLSIFGLSIVALALMQDVLNQISDFDNFNGQYYNGQNYNNNQYNSQYNNQNYYNGQYNNQNYNNPNNNQNNGQM